MPLCADMLGVRAAGDRRAWCFSWRHARCAAPGEVPTLSPGRVGSAPDEATTDVSMEKRAIIAAVLMAIVFVAGQYLLFPATPENRPGRTPDASQAPAKTEPEKPAASAAQPTA